MMRIKAVVGVCALCAIAFSAIVVQSAAGAGTTGFTCVKKIEQGGAGFSDAHCNTAVGTGATFEHVVIAENLQTEGLVTNQNTASGTTASSTAKLHGSLSGVVVEIQATGTEGVGTGFWTGGAGEHYIVGTGVTTYTGASVTKPAGKGCKITGGTITTKSLSGTTQGQGMAGKLVPTAGTEFATIPIEGCSIGSLNNKFPVTGSVTCPINGATISCLGSQVTAESTLKFGGVNAGIEVGTTFKNKANGIPLVPTT